MALLTGNHNILIGRDAGMNLTTGSYNIGIGQGALSDITTECGVIEIAGVRVVDLKTAEELAPLLHEYVKALLLELR